MTKPGFLHTLHREKALQLVEPGSNIRDGYLRKSESFLASARLLLEHERYEESVSMAYYSMYYAVLALFFASGIKCENHTAAGIILREVFGIDSTALEAAKTERIDKQYYLASAPVRSEVIALIRTAESFNAVLRDVTDRLTNRKIETYRASLKKLMGSP